MKPKKVLIAAGGTGGHIFPGLAVAEQLTQQAYDVVWVGTAQGMESRLVPAAGFRLTTIDVQGLRGKGWKKILLAPFKLAQALVHAQHCLKQERPDLVLGMGGYVSGPIGLAAWLRGIPIIIHEQNAIAGMTNKILAQLATRVLESFPATFKAAKKVVYTGNPVRNNLLALTGNTTNKFHSPLHILVLGGSLGAHPINRVLPETIATFSADQCPHVWHQTGIKDQETTEQLYQQHRIKNVKTAAFIDDMAAAYNWADLVICRAGATTVAELAVVGLPAIFIPFPQAVDDHQTANANNLAKIHAAVILPQSELTIDRLFTEISRFVNKPEMLQQMAQQAASFAKKDAVQRVVAECSGVVK